MTAVNPSRGVFDGFLVCRHVSTCRYSLSNIVSVARRVTLTFYFLGRDSGEHHSARVSRLTASLFLASNMWIVNVDGLHSLEIQSIQKIFKSLQSRKPLGNYY